MVERKADRLKTQNSTQTQIGDAAAPAHDATISSEEPRRIIAESAYYRAERRGFQGGRPEQDWFEAEAELDARLLCGRDEI